MKHLKLFALSLVIFTFSSDAFSCEYGSSYSVKPIEDIQKAINEAPVVVVAKRYPEGVQKAPYNLYASKSSRPEFNPDGSFKKVSLLKSEPERFFKVKVVKTLKGKVDEEIINVDSTPAPCTGQNIFNLHDDHEHILLLEKTFSGFYSAAFGIESQSAFYFETLPSKPGATPVYYDEKTKQHISISKFMEKYKF